jgi:hypothetical protein
LEELSLKNEVPPIKSLEFEFEENDTIFDDLKASIVNTTIYVQLKKEKGQ